MRDRIDSKVRAELKRLHGATDQQLKRYSQQLSSKRLAWYDREQANLDLGTGDVVERGYRLLLRKLGISESQAPVVHKDRGSIVFHSKNICPTLEACRILGLDTRRVCRLYNESSTDQLIRQLDPRLRFRRNYNNIRPYSEYCEERIEYEGE
jgi:tRNA(adenine34) deaminase